MIAAKRPFALGGPCSRTAAPPLRGLQAEAVDVGAQVVPQSICLGIAIFFSTSAGS